MPSGVGLNPPWRNRLECRSGHARKASKISLLTALWGLRKPSSSRLRGWPGNQRGLVFEASVRAYPVNSTAHRHHHRLNK